MYCVRCVFSPWNIYDLEPKYITTVLMKNLCQQVLVWKFTLTLWNTQITAFLSCTVWLHLNIQSGEVGAGEHHCRGHCQKDFFLSFLLICFLHAVCECPIADICCVHVYGPLASYSRRCRMLISPYPCCYVTALIFFPHLTVITQKCHASLTLSAHLLPNHVHERQ